MDTWKYEIYWEQVRYPVQHQKYISYFRAIMYNLFSMFATYKEISPDYLSSVMTTAIKLEFLGFTTDRMR